MAVGFDGTVCDEVYVSALPRSVVVNNNEAC